MKKFIILFLLLIVFLAGCPQPEPDLKTPEHGFGWVSDLKIERGWSGAVFTPDMLKQNQLRFGLIDVYFIEISGNKYAVEWGELQEYSMVKKGLKRIYFSSTGFILRAGRGEWDRKDYRIVKITLPEEYYQSPKPSVK